MKKLGLVMAAVVLLPLAANAQPAMSNSKHDLSQNSTSTGPRTTDAVTRVCVFCHVPHNASTTTNGIWNRTNPTATFTTWGAGSPTIGGTTLPGGMTVGGGSIRCFSCHDGTTALGGLLNSPTGAALNMNATLGATYTIDRTDMAGNHPVSVAYPGETNAYLSTTSRADTAGYETVAQAITNGMRLYNDGDAYGIECGSCHEPHDTTNVFFLRDTLDNSTLCVNCHAK